MMHMCDVCVRETESEKQQGGGSREGAAGRGAAGRRGQQGGGSRKEGRQQERGVAGERELHISWNDKSQVVHRRMRLELITTRHKNDSG